MGADLSGRWVCSYGGATMGCVGLGWLAGPFVGNTLWRLVHRSKQKAMEFKDKGSNQPNHILGHSHTLQR